MSATTIKPSIDELMDSGFTVKEMAMLLNISEEEVKTSIHNWVWDDPDDSMDGDFDSGMASAGFGTDEDYGCLGD
jgi:hypothetical protein